MSERRRLAVVVVGALLVRIVLLMVRGDYLVYDEAYYLLLARSLREGHGYTLNGLTHVALSPLQPVLVAGISLLGISDLWGSRLLGAAAGALLPLPVYALARSLSGSRGGLAAALVVAVAPALMSYTPFFPGRAWNLYFGTEPLYLLLAFGAAAGAAHAVATGRAAWFAAAGALCGLVFLARAEGLIVGPLVLAAGGVALLFRRAGAGGARRLVLAAVVALVVASPYLFFLRAALGRWAVSGRVQMRGAGQPVVPTASQRGGSVLEAFVWGGDAESFRRELYSLDASGTRMRSQYWGVARAEAAPPDPPPAALAPAAQVPPQPDSPAPPSRARSLLRGIGAVTPWWIALAGLGGLVLARRNAALVWLTPGVVAGLLPALLVYVEPRSLLPLLPVAAILAGVLWDRLSGQFESLGARGLAMRPLVGIGLLAGLMAPAVRDGWRSRAGDTPLQRLATAQRAIGSILADSLPSTGPLMSWHPAIALWAGRDWRVLPYEPLDRVLGYAAHERVAAVVLSRFYPSPLDDLPRSFTAILPGAPAADTTGGPGAVRLQRVMETPLLFVGRLEPAAP